MAHSKGAFAQLKYDLFVEEAPIAWIEYSQFNRTILLNDGKPLAQLHFAAQNDLVFTYLYNNPNRIITLKELEAEATREPLHKTLHEFVRAFGFTGFYRRMFFDVSKQAILFRKEVYPDDIRPYESLAPFLSSIARLMATPQHRRNVV
jgi:hypothetical protein